MYVDLKVVSDPASLHDVGLNITDDMVYVVDAKSFFSRPGFRGSAIAFAISSACLGMVVWRQG
jgi:hypothetical protein